MVLSWYEQKAVCILLTLLHLGIKNIRLGPTLPAFVSPNVLNYLVENFGIAPITTPGDKCILQLRGLPPFFSPKYDLKRHPNYRYTAEADKQKNAFDLDRLINRRRRPGLNEACTMYEVAVPDDALTEEDEDILNYDDIDDPDAFA